MMVLVTGAKNVQKIIVKYYFWCQFSPQGDVVTPKIWVPLKLAHQYGLFGTLESQIRYTIMVILTVGKNSAR